MSDARDWIGDAEKWLRDQFDRVVRAAGEPGMLNIEPALAAEEAEWLLQGLEADLFNVTSDGYVESELLPAPCAKNKPQKTVQLFWHYETGRRLFREGVCQMAAAATLVLRYGWQRREVYFEPSKAELGALAYGVDLLVRDADQGRVVVCCEVKRNEQELERLLVDMRICGSRSPHEKADCDQRANHPKVATCRKVRPRYFWAVCPGRRDAFRVDYGPETVGLHKIGELPDRVAALATLPNSG